MKKHAIIPIFISHKGCPNDCVFCNQRKITARTAPVEKDDVKNIIEQYLPTLEGRGLDTIEVAFFGGSFTGIPIPQQTEYLSVALQYKQCRRIDKIHLSTRPDYISPEILDNLKSYGVDVIELGVQSFDPQVLEASKRGHSVSAVYNACKLIKTYGFELGIQLMIGLPGDTMTRALDSAKKAAELKPSVARLYPTVILEDTELSQMYQNGTYTPLSEDDAVAITKEMYRILHDAGINIIRVGLKSTDLINTGSDLGGGYHPAFRQLVEGEIAKEDLLAALQAELKSLKDFKDPKTSRNRDASCPCFHALFLSNNKSFSNMVGHKGCNREFFKNYFAEEFPKADFSYKADDTFRDYQYKVLIDQI